MLTPNGASMPKLNGAQQPVLARTGLRHVLCGRPDGAQHIGLIRRHVGMTVDDVLPAVDGQADRTAERVNS